MPDSQATPAPAAWFSFASRLPADDNRGEVKWPPACEDSQAGRPCYGASFPGEPVMTVPQETPVVLREGEAAPAFDLAAHPEGRVSLADFRGKKNVVLAFYPRDDTPGCTREMCGFSDDLDKFASANTAVLG